MQLSELLDDAWVQTYQRRIGALHTEIVRVRTRLFILREISDFPFDLFGYGDAETFWRTTHDALSESVISGLWRITLDEDRRVLTLPRFRDDVLDHAKDQKAREHIAALVEKAEFESRFDAIKQDLRDIRHTQVAHLNAGLVDGTVPGRRRSLSLGAVEAVADALDKLLNALGLDRAFETIMLDYSKNVINPPGDDGRADIEDILRRIVVESQVLNMPEQRPVEFPYYWDARSERQKTRYNEYRKKFNLTEIDPGLKPEVM